MSWFHCGRCGSLFQSPAGDVEDRRCAKCGLDPSLGLSEKPAEPRTSQPVTARENEIAEQQGKRSARKLQKRRLLIKVICVSSVLLALIVFKANRPASEEPPEHKPAASVRKDVPTVTAEDFELLNKGVSKCVQTFAGFISAGTPEERNQFVVSPIDTTTRMVRFYSLNPLTNLDPASLSMTGNAVLHVPGAKMIETQWKSNDGKKIDAVFREESGEWRLDWDHFARYGDYPWALFLSGSGPSEGEFRLLARERLAEERKDSEAISVVLYSPRFGHPDVTGFQSPEFLVSRNTRDGQLLDAAFKLARSGKQVFDSTLPNLNPEEMIRVRVKVRRTEVDEERKFEITEVAACHWFSVNDPGVQPLVRGENNTQER